ncbi:MAG: hypothetical protein AB1468_06345 [Candidatus Micrarchaeota archaeon]
MGFLSKQAGGANTPMYERKIMFNQKVPKGTADVLEILFSKIKLASEKKSLETGPQWFGVIQVTEGKEDEGKKNEGTFKIFLFKSNVPPREGIAPLAQNEYLGNYSAALVFDSDFKVISFSNETFVRNTNVGKTTEPISLGLLGKNEVVFGITAEDMARASNLLLFEAQKPLN